MRSSLLLRGSIALALLGGWLVGCSAFVRDPGLAQILTLLGLIVALQVGPLVLTRRPDLFEPPVYTGLVAAFASASSIAYLAGEEQIQLPILGSVAPQEDLAAAYRSVLAIILGLVGYYIGYYSRVGPRFRRLFPEVKGLIWDQGRMLGLALLLTLAFASAYIVFHLRVGTSIFAILDQAAGKAAWRDDPTLSWMLRGVQLGLIPALLFIVHRLSVGQPGRTMIAPLLLLGVTMLLVSRVGGRGIWASALLTAVCLFHYLRRRLPVAAFAAIYFLGLIFANTVLQYRLPEEQRTLPTAGEIVARPSSVLQAHEADRMRFETLAVVMYQFPEHEPYLMGKSWLYMVMAPIPRWLWPEKLDYRDFLDNSIVFRISGVPAPTPFVGILYANLSWLGIVLGMMLYGMFHRGLYEWMRDGSGDKSVAFLYALILIHFVPTSLGVSAALQYIVPVWLAIRLAGRRPAPIRAPAPA